MIGSIFAWLLVLVAVAFTVVPISRLPHGAVRSFSFARQQCIILSLVSIPIAYWLLAGWERWIAVLILAAVVVTQLLYISRFMPFARVQSLNADAELAADRDRQVSILTANVKLSNRQFQRLIDLAREVDPDVLTVVEIDERWVEALSVLEDTYPYRAIRPLDNGYGMGVYSRLPLEEVEWRELLREEVPSLRAVLRIDGEPVRLYILHPEPPVPYHSTEGRDAEIGLVGIEVSKEQLPSIVAGDLNDVAWSHTTRRFQRLSNHLDPRVGRGFYNTFHAQVPIWRWPLDHLFHSERFRLVEMKRLPDIGSDHFPMLFCLALARTNGAGDRPDPEREDDREDIREMAKHEREEDREPIGSDWENER